ncbi:MAG: tRNA (adenosine(37)-N6)-threonylcarbamoyltransferase complex ATPase subunit type 1 TsaE [Patescibacteria group bacterium]
MKISSNSTKVTQSVAKLLAEEVLKNRPKTKNALVFALSGDLGAGKTTFIQGFVKGLGIKNRLTSPTFLIFRRYKLRVKSYESFFHVDAYRLKKTKELDVLGLKNEIADPKNIIAIEWAERIKKILPKNSVWLKFEHHRENERIISINLKK